MDQRRIKKQSRQGFTLIEVLFSLSIIFMILLNISSLAKIIKLTDEFNYYENECSLAAYKISYYLMKANYISIDCPLVYKEGDKQYSLDLDGDRIVITPGYNILMDDVEDLDFYEKNDGIYMKLECNGHVYEYLVGADYAYKE